MTGESDAARPPARYDGRTAVEHASDAESAVLAVLHLAEANAVPLSVEEVYRTLSGLTRAFEHMPEAVTRLRAAALRQHELETLTVTSGRFTGDPDAALKRLADAVDAMLASFGAVRTGLDDAQAALAGVSTTQ